MIFKFEGFIETELQQFVMGRGDRESCHLTMDRETFSSRITALE